MLERAPRVPYPNSAGIVSSIIPSSPASQ
jgi:hypothetical protein